MWALHESLLSEGTHPTMVPLCSSCCISCLIPCSAIVGTYNWFGKTVRKIISSKITWILLCSIILGSWNLLTIGKNVVKLNMYVVARDSSLHNSLKIEISIKTDFWLLKQDFIHFQVPNELDWCWLTWLLLWSVGSLVLRNICDFPPFKGMSKDHVY